MSESNLEPAPPFIVKPPFDSASSGDCVLRSSDGVDFKTCRAILCAASTVFHDMFSIPTTASPGESEGQLIELQEDTETLQSMLQMIYPVDPPTAASPLLISKLVRAFDKYFVSMTKLRDHVRHMICSPESLASSPMISFAVAWRLGLGEEAARASRYTHRSDISDPKMANYIVEISGDATALAALWELRLKRSEGLDGLLDAAEQSFTSYSSRRAETYACHGEMECEFFPGEFRKACLREALMDPYPNVGNVEDFLGFRLSLPNGASLGGDGSFLGRPCPRCCQIQDAQLDDITDSAITALQKYPQQIIRFPRPLGPST